MEDLRQKRIKAIFEIQKQPFKKEEKGYHANYKYMALSEVLKIVNPIFERNGILFYQNVGAEVIDGTVMIVCESIFEGHGDQDVFKSAMPYKQFPEKIMSGPQSVGSHYTYLKRYHLLGLLGIEAEEDTDGASQPYRSNNNTRQEPRESPPRPQSGQNKAGDLPSNKEVYEAIMGSILPENEKSEIWAQFQGKPEKAKSAYWKFILSRINGK